MEHTPETVQIAIKTSQRAELTSQAWYGYCYVVAELNVIPVKADRHDIGDEYKILVTATAYSILKFERLTLFLCIFDQTYLNANVCD